MRYKLDFVKKGKLDIEEITRSGNKAINANVLRIFLELMNDPRVGIGKPEKLKHLKGDFWSRRLDDKNRLIYEIVETAREGVEAYTVIITQALGHYEDK
ncbi:toxin-antitoxin system, toxin component, Txe/YoeB family [Capnocytophaga haemolytica]|jgi:addiction module toxin, txe/yoeB family|uniref:Toxin RelK n=1 Tax=Capnocytophaga haemolytica TaxID=45243 RepID=A0AAX2GZE3_9FLAO|nr:Txe/YoeB family addiction module toxin [Capnocytophaga haemolytica]AMD84082.1 hypothetical protein AXF12_00110 [Capnocytophaga haemolytica]SFO06349.1 toxin-antitoxin system, toxin component, Txe/YoeB family [Capnocytophaga haemolytica]SNV13614.1 Toxin RelK [Capnocytophaga haemolytica]